MEEHMYRAFENRVLRKIPGPKQDKVTRGYRKLHEEHPDSYSSSNIFGLIKEDKGGVCGMYGEKKNTWCGNLKERNPLEYLRADGRKTHLKDLKGLEGVVCINLAQDRDKWRALVNTTMNLQVPANGVEGGIS
jgi:hypothetical protein